MKIQINFKNKDIVLIDKVELIEIIPSVENSYVFIGNEVRLEDPYYPLKEIEVINVDGETIYESDEYFFRKVDAIKSLPKIFEEISKFIQKEEDMK